MAKTTKTTRKSAQFNMQVSAEIDAIDNVADDAMLLAGLIDEIVEDDAPVIAVSDEDALEAALSEMGIEAADDTDLDLESAIEAAVSDLEKTEAVQALYEEQDKEAAVESLFESAADKPLTDPETASETVAKKGKKAKKAAVEDAEKPEKAPKAYVPRYTNSKTSEVLKHKLGEKWAEFLILEAEDAELSPEALAEKQSELLKMLDVRPGTAETAGTQKKVAEKVVMLFGWMSKGGTLNEVMRRTFEVLCRDGEITTGEKGNLQQHLLAKPYSIGTARAQAGQMMAMLPMLKIAQKSDKGRLVANPNSIALMKVKAELGLQ